jgi:hypothetical protein
MGGSDRERREAVLARAELRTRRQARGLAARRAATMRAVSALQLAVGASRSMSR